MCSALFLHGISSGTMSYTNLIQVRELHIMVRSVHMNAMGENCIKMTCMATGRAKTYICRVLDNKGLTMT